MRSQLVRNPCVVLLLLLLTSPLSAQTPPASPKLEPVASKYTKFEYRVPMRDGIKLFTAVYVPKDDTKTYPILFTRTPYGVGPYGADQYRAKLGPSAHFEKSGYIFVYQDVRGRMKSEGEFLHVRPHNPKKKPTDIDESSDAYDTIEWLLKNIPGHNGKVGMWGISYPGFYTACGMIDAHPALKAASPQAPVMDMFDGDDSRHHGAFMLAHNFGFFAAFPKMAPERIKKPDLVRFDYGTPDGYQFFLDMGPLENADTRYLKGVEPFWRDLMAREIYDEGCKASDLRPHLRDIKPAVLTVGGWYDAEDLTGTLEGYQKVEKFGSPKAGNHLVMGPWVHGGWAGSDGDKLGDVSFRARTAEYYREHIEFPFFEHHLKSVGTPKTPKAWMFETGTNRWRRFDAWPPKAVVPTKLVFQMGGKLERGSPKGEGRETFDEFVSDPAKPVPYLGTIGTGMATEYMTADQRFAASRPDVLVYQTPPLETDLTIAGPFEIDLHVSTTGTDADWVVKLVDVYPKDYPDADPNPEKVRMGGYQQLVRSDVMRGKFRNSLEKPEPFVPGQATRVKFTAPDVLHTFRSGHRVMVQVQSSCFPLFDRNPQRFGPIASAKESEFQRQTHRVYTSPKHPSQLEVLVLP